MPGMPEFTHRHDMQKSTSLSTKDMQQWHSHQDHQGCEPTYFNTSYLMRSYVICSEIQSYLLFIQCLFNVYYTVLYIWGFVSPSLCILCIQHLTVYLQSLALRLSRLRFPPRAWPPCELRQEHGRKAKLRRISMRFKHSNSVTALCLLHPCS